MNNEHQIAQMVCAAKGDVQLADELIRSYLPFIRSEAAKFMGRACTEEDDENSIAMMAFYEAVMSYEKGRGAFLPYAAMLIRSRLIDESRREKRHRNQISLEEENGDGRTVMDTLAVSEDPYELRANLEATQQEIGELAGVMERFQVSFADVADHAPRQERTAEACKKAIRYAGGQPELLDELLKTGRLPMAALVEGAGVERKTLERHRKYILAMLLIQTNGYEIIRGHLRHLLKREGGVQA